MARLPISLQSFAIQAIALCLALVLGTLARILLPIELAFVWWQIAVFQGAIAAALSRLAGQPSWWLLLHGAFLPAVVLVREAQLPSELFLMGFILLAVFYWSSYRTRVPLYLSDRKAWQAVASLLPQGTSFTFIDVGSGLGGVPFYLERRFPDGRFVGTEIAPAPWLISRLRAWFKRSQVRLLRRDYTALDLSEYDAVFAFLSPAAMPALWRQASEQMRRGALFMSLSFDVDTRPPEQTVSFSEGERHTLYAWRM